MKIEVDSSDVLKAAIDLDAMEAAAIRAGYAVESIQQHSDYMAASIRVVRDQIEAEMASLLRAEGIIQGVGGATQNATEQMHNFRFGVANVAAQFQDIAVTAQMGMNPMIIALQQGTQLSAALAANGGGVASMGMMLKDAFLSVISPVSLITIGVVAAAAATTQWLMSLQGQTKTADDALRDHADLIGEIKDRYGDAGDALDEYLKKGPEELAAMTRANITELRRQMTDALAGNTFMGGAGGLFSMIETSYARGPGGGVKEYVEGQFQPFEDAIFALRQSIRDGNPDFEKFYQTINQQVKMEPELRSAADALISASKGAADLARSLEQAGVAAVTINDTVINTFRAIEDMRGLNDVSIPELDFMLGQTAEIERSAQAHRIELDAIVAKSPAQLADIARRREALDLADEEISEANRLAQIEQAGAEAYAAAAFEIAESQRQRLRAAQDNVAQNELELSLIGQSIEEITRQRFVRQELAQAEEEAAQNGVSVSLAYIQAIEEIGAAYGRLQREIAERGAISDLMFARTQMGRSKTEATVAESLREIYGDDFASQMDGFIANQIRVNETLSEFDQIGQKATETWLVGFVEAWKANFLESETDKASARMQYASELLDETMRNSGEVTQDRRLEIVRLSSAMAEAEYGATAMQRAWNSAWEAMGDISIRVLDQLANKALSMAADGIWDMIFAGVTGALGVTGPGVGAQTLGSLAGALAGAVTQGHANGVQQAPSGLAWVGERGPELMNFRGGERVTSAPESMAALMQQSSRAVENHYHIDAQGAELGVETKIANALDEWERNRLPYALKAYEDNDTRVG